MHAESFDRLVGAFGRARADRRAALGGAFALIAVRAGLRQAAPVAAACRPAGKKCAKSRHCCGGARCKGKRCRCLPGHQSCGNTCCIPGQFCLVLPNVEPGCVNGGIAIGEPCDPSYPGACQTGVCGCPDNGGACICRLAECAAPGEPCIAHVSCCEGVCLPQAGFICSG